MAKTYADKYHGNCTSMEKIQKEANKLAKRISKGR